MYAVNFSGALALDTAREETATVVSNCHTESVMGGSVGESHPRSTAEPNKRATKRFIQLLRTESA
jgi:hypothetical protein